MSNQQRIALIVAALVVAVVAFLLVSPGNDDDEPERSAVTTQAQDEPQTETGDDSAEPQPTTEEEPPPPPEPQITRINIKGGTVVGGAKTIDVVKGRHRTDRRQRRRTRRDPPARIRHQQTAAPGQPARFRFKANAEGEFEIESHVAEDAGLDPLVARLVVRLRDPVRPRAGRPFRPPDPGVALRLGGGDGAGRLVRRARGAVARAQAGARALAAAAGGVRARARQPAGGDRVRRDRRRSCSGSWSTPGCAAPRAPPPTSRPRSST